jgi:hypothetical protein
MDVLTDFEGEEWFSKEAGWNQKLADAVKAALRGKKCVMQDFDAPHKLGEAVPDLIGESGLPVVKELTDELIDELGPDPEGVLPLSLNSAVEKRHLVV